MESYRYSDHRSYDVFDPVSEIANDILCVIIVLKHDKEEQVYVNKYGKLVFGDLPCYTYYYLGPFDLLYIQEHGFSLHHGVGSRASGNPLHSQVSRWKFASSSRKGDLQYCYEAIIACHMKYSANEISWTQTFNRHRLQPPPSQSNDSVFGPHYQKALYMPGGILSDLQHLFSPRRVLVGRARPWPHEWKWDISLRKQSSWGEVVNSSLDKFVIQSTNF